MLILCDRKNAKNSKQARSFVDTWLQDNNFLYQGGCFFGGVADWYVIGGRWSGELTEALLDKKKVKKFKKEFEEKYGWYIGGKEHITREQRQKQARELFDKYFPNYKGRMPFWRDTYRYKGYSDDAMIVSDKLFDNLKLSKLEQGPEGIVNIEGDEITKEKVVGKKWIVVVDYHT